MRQYGSSTTLAAISGLVGDKNARTGDAGTGITPIFDADQVKQDVQAQAAITQAFGSQASQLVETLPRPSLRKRRTSASKPS